ncbi:transcriptional regulator [Streptomyces sp. NPDC047017]|uniref:transcriptional regulator n=1 Tax=Streptomyces sp. NPDC047017 TaxID=3155024 RepID=UPI003408D2CC
MSPAPPPPQSPPPSPSPAPPPAINQVIHHPTRLIMMAFLAGCAEAEFAAVRDYCQVSDPSVSRITTALEEAGYLTVRKGAVGRRPRTWLSLTPTGRTALETHLAALQSLADAARTSGTENGPAAPRP